MVSSPEHQPRLTPGDDGAVGTGRAAWLGDGATTDGFPARTSARARRCLLALVVGYFAMATVAGAPNSPLTVLLPAGVRGPYWSVRLATAIGAARVGREGLIGLAWVLVLVVLAAFALLLVEAWANRVRLPAVLTASVISLAIAVAAPLLLSRDVYTYAAYGRIEALYGQNPYVARLSSFPHDPFVATASVQWLPTHSHYGPLFSLVSAAVARTWADSPGATILMFKLMGGLAVAVAAGFVTLTAVRTRPDRAPLAAALVGLNPVIVIHTVGGGHVDALLAAPLAAAMAIAVTRPQRQSARAITVTLLLTAACLVKVVMAPVLVLWVWSLVDTRRTGRGRVLAAHGAAIVAAVAVSTARFVAGWHTLAPFTTLGGIEVWASPSHLVGHVARLVIGSFAGPSAGRFAAGTVEAGFLVLFVVLLVRLARASTRSGPAAAPERWGLTLLLLALSMPFLLPWYAAWFVPFIAFFADRLLVAAGALVTGVLALTLIPADPFYGYSTRGVMDGVHYGAASALLIVLLIVVTRVVRWDGVGDRVGTMTAASREHDLGPAISG